MRILELSTARIWGGGEVHLRALCFGLLRRGHDVTVACEHDGPLCRILADDGLTPVPLDKEEDPGALARLAVAERIDLIHAHQSRGARLAVGARYLAGRSRAIMTRHALGPVDEDLPRTGLARVIAVSEAVARDCLADGFPADRVTVVPNGVDPARFRPGFPPASREQLGLPPKARTIVLVGRLIKDKGVLTALEALLPLIAQTELYLLILGEGEKRVKMERLVRQAELAEKVLFLGRQADVRPFLALAETVVAPGPREAFGLAILEAMAVGRPVVAVEAGGVPEVITDGVHGLLVPPDDGLGLAAAIYRLAGDPVLRRRLGEAARERALEFTEERMVRETEAVMEEVLAQR